MTTPTIESRDLLEEAGRIQRRETMLLATSAHLAAVIALVAQAKILIEGESRYNDAVRDWLKEAAKVLA